MLSVTIHKDISDYKPKIFGGLTARSIIYISAAIGVSLFIGIYCQFALKISSDIWLFLIIAIATPIWFCGFKRPYGMYMEEFIPLWFRHNFRKNKIYYVSSDILYKYAKINPPREIVKENEVLTGRKVDKYYELLCKRPDFEAYEPDIDMGLSEEELQALPSVNTSIFQKSLSQQKDDYIQKTKEEIKRRKQEQLSNSGKIKRRKQEEEDDLLLSTGFLTKGKNDNSLNNQNIFRKENLSLKNNLPEIDLRQYQDQEDFNNNVDID